VANTVVDFDMAEKAHRT